MKLKYYQWNSSESNSLIEWNTWSSVQSNIESGVLILIERIKDRVQIDRLLLLKQSTYVNFEYTENILENQS